MIATGLRGTDQFGNEANAKLHKRNHSTGLITYTDTLHEWVPVFIPAINNTYGTEMAQDFSFGGTPVPVHDGIDSVLWTGTNETGNKFTFNSTDQAHSGSNSIKANKPAVNNVMQLDNGSGIDMSNYTALTMYIYVSSNWSGGDSMSIYGWDTGTGLQVGDAVFLEDYFNESDFNTWHKIVIPLGDIAVTASTLDAIRIECVSTLGQSPIFYIDDVQIEETGNTQTFSLAAGEGSMIEVNQISFAIVAALDTTLLNATMPNISYNQFLGLPALDNGLLFQSIKNGQVQFGGGAKTVGQLIKGGSTLKNVICDGTNTCITLESDFGSPTIVDARTNDSLNFILSDDLSGLISMSVLYKGRARAV